MARALAFKFDVAIELGGGCKGFNGFRCAQFEMAEMMEESHSPERA